MNAAGHATQGHRDSAADGQDKTGAGGAEKTGSYPPGGSNESSPSSIVGLIQAECQALVWRLWRNLLGAQVKRERSWSDGGVLLRPDLKYEANFSTYGQRIIQLITVL